ncbi:hypothetical protein PHLCEN_2v7311 [Hermanssonia centrifuga]|uniref:Cyclopropane-fatty-acyl-phospholipid synthase n=1 Tax=Hermanssonia centrifuga TaxID=98765 RepID=A0A2R6NWV3_9APHY|nr:hypothetical protein PHLCEN_2v7311 [Hermanssonia centrifuga]
MPPPTSAATSPALLPVTSNDEPTSVPSNAHGIKTGVFGTLLNLSGLQGVAERLAEVAIVGILKNMKHGRLTLRTASHTYIFPTVGTNDEETSATIDVVSSYFFLRLLSARSPDLGFAEAYMFGDVRFGDDDELLKVFTIFIMNQDCFSSLAGLGSSSSSYSSLTSLLSLSTRAITAPARALVTRLTSHTLDDARANISAHYDLGNDMFMAFLSQDMTYSCALFPSLDADIKTTRPSSPSTGTGASTPTVVDDGDDSLFKGCDPLHQAQLSKLSHIIAKADIRPGHRVLEIGSGWGSMALLITSTIPGTTVDTLTLSTQQAEYVRRKVRQAALEDSGDEDKEGERRQRVRVHLMDYRAMPKEWEGAFDRVVSVEMVEAVGRDFLDTYFAAIDWALKKDTGVGVIQGITIPEGRYDEYVKQEDFIRKWVFFPGGILPTLTLLTHTLTHASRGTLVVDSVSNIGPHYARTLREWRARFTRGFGPGGLIEQGACLCPPPAVFLTLA